MIELQGKEEELLAAMKDLEKIDPKALQEFMDTQGIEGKDYIAKESGALGQDR